MVAQNTFVCLALWLASSWLRPSQAADPASSPQAATEPQGCPNENGVAVTTWAHAPVVQRCFDDKGLQKGDLVGPDVVHCRPNISCDAVAPFQNYKRYRGLTKPKRGNFHAQAGWDHYRLLGWLSQQVPNSIVSEIGTYFGDGSFAMGSEPSNYVYSFDIVDKGKGIYEMNKMSPARFHTEAPNIHFVQANVLSMHKCLQLGLLSSSIILLDTLHLPYTKPFEMGFFQWLVDHKYKGMLLLDDITLTAEMRRWWRSITFPTKYNITIVGHATGTGLVDFSGKALFTPEEGEVCPYHIRMKQLIDAKERAEGGRRRKKKGKRK